MSLDGIHIAEFSRYFSSAYVRGYCYLQRFGELLDVTVISKGNAVPHIFKLCDVHENGAQEFSVEFMHKDGGVPEDVNISFIGKNDQCVCPLVDLHQSILDATELGLTERFIDLTENAHNEGQVKLLDVGGRARSKYQRSKDFPNWDCTVLDIVEQDGVDVVCDAHIMSTCLEPESFDAVISVSVFEHILMPWKLCLEINRVIKPGGYVLVHTHQTIGMHDIPWDFWRFSDQAWNALFNRKTGFEIIETRMDTFSRIIPAVYTERHKYAERSGGFEGSSVIARKIGETDLSWDVSVEDVLRTSYPEHDDGSS